MGMVYYMVDSTFGSRVAAAQKQLGISVAEIARRAGVNYDNVRDLIRRPGSSTSVENATKIAAVLGIQLADDRPALERAENHAPAPTNGAQLVPVYDVAASAGFGATVEYESLAYSLAFPPAYLSRLTSSDPSNLVIISVKGDSMEPTLLDDDIVLLDASKTNLSFDGLFVLRFDDALHVKRVGRSAKRGHVTIISDNQAFPTLEAAAADVEAVGKVLWYGRKV